MTNNAKNFVANLVGLTFTFKPEEKGKDRPVQTINIHEQIDMPISSGGTVPAFKCTLTFSGKRGIIQTQREISVARMLEYVAQAAASDVEYEEVIYVATDKPVKVAGEKTEKQIAREAAAAEKAKAAAEKAEAKAKLAAEKAAAAKEKAKSKKAAAGGDPDTVNDATTWDEDNAGDPFPEDDNNAPEFDEEDGF